MKREEKNGLSRMSQDEKENQMRENGEEIVERNRA